MDEGFQVSAASFTRKYHKGRLPSCEVAILGEIEHGNFLMRAIKMIKALPKLRSQVKEADIIYAFGVDMGLLCIISAIGLLKHVAVEIGDIRSAQVQKNLKGRLVRILDKYIVSNCKLMIATSIKFVEEYYQKNLKVKTKTIILENKLERQQSDRQQKTKTGFLEHNIVIIGYFGLLRCSKSIRVLTRLASNYPNNIKLFVAGYSLVDDAKFAKLISLKNVEYFGEYKSPGNLFEIYSKVDLVWSVYPFPNVGELNWKWARTNRFYESCYFRKPMIALEGSADGDIVREHKIGFTVEDVSEDEIVRCVWENSHENFELYQQNIFNLPEEVYLYTQEGKQLKEALIHMANN
ncbi:glycosyltransferase family 4 protein [Flagellimonas hymeniacidonis]|uniref:Glycosyltransferase family 4 protein n=1 Tax=Flagellimonas hymeniacidonis TaxID=2603628 RepID=A0A5C8V6A8_9FLAO|nr:glycosyltransferase family 4 protein [Flagellimonas hymeniacidonis]TXN37624.1 glycosyltransferase family 4 protein [Flagellimonas hymeniacidonis]